MAEILLMKTIKILIAWYCYLGSGLVAVAQLPGVDIVKAMNINPSLQRIAIYLLIVMWLVKIVWFIYDKFHLERRERNLKMDITREEIIDMKDGHKKEKGANPQLP